MTTLPPAKLATRRLIDASATLPAADRALLSLWTQRGLDDAAMAQMTGVDSATIAERRSRIVADLSTELGLPPQDVAAALSAIAESAAESIALRAGQGVPAPPAPPGLGNGAGATAPPAKTQAMVEPVTHHTEARPDPESPSSEAPGRRRRLLWRTAALLGIVIAVIIVVAAGSGGGSPPRATPTNAPPAAANAKVRTFAPLPGGTPGATGTVTLLRDPAGTQRVHVRVSGLPSVGSDYYEVWLYNSIIDSVPLGRLRPGGSGSFTLPATVTRFAWIDISRQPAGSILPSGDSVLRTTNPLASAPH